MTTRTPEETYVYENLVRLEYERQCGGVFFQKGVPVEMHVTAYYRVPKSVSKKRTSMMLSGQIRPQKKPDLDNIIKALSDGCNGVAFYDDVQIVEMSIRKFYGEIPRVEVILREVLRNEDRSLEEKGVVGS